MKRKILKRVGEGDQIRESEKSVKGDDDDCRVGTGVDNRRTITKTNDPIKKTDSIGGIRIPPANHSEASRNFSVRTLI